MHSTAASDHPRQPKRLRLPVIVGSLLLGVVVTGGAAKLARMSYVPTGLDYATTRTSDAGLFRATYTPSVMPIPVNKMHSWTLHLETPDGKLVEDAKISVDGDMPQHGHGLPTRPVANVYLGRGDYLVEGLKFQMGGWWVMDFKVTAQGKTDTVHFNMMLEK
ncbi:FixH family protein [Deinococcus pimensis]|uniref:FixH family protein n=1 Tax=Deinococcus pimensis TaxID=309888 RepID=UPI0004B839BE|nr:FixH family protein [Deinococcus pimensis]